MSSDHIQEWRDYLATRIHAQHGLAKHEAQRLIDHWLRSVNVTATQPKRREPAKRPAKAAATS